jgi:hypothetical protein
MTVWPHKSIYELSTAGHLAELIIDELYRNATTALDRKAAAAAPIIESVRARRIQMVIRQNAGTPANAPPPDRPHLLCSPVTEPALPLTGRRSALVSPREAKTRADLTPRRCLPGALSACPGST